MPTTLEQIQYGFDRDSRRTWKRRALAVGEDDHYRYDALSQVTAAARGSLNLNLTAIGGRPASEQSWDYDPTGNWRGFDAAENGNPILDQHRVHDRGNRLTQIEGSPAAVVLDRAGRMRQAAPDAGGDWNGNLELTWDAWSRVTSVKSNGETVGEYAYDGLTRRTTREVSGVTWHSYYSDAWRPLEERKDSETTAAISYLWGARHRDDLVRRDRAVGGTTLNETRYVLMDYFSAAAITDAAGVVEERYAYGAFGIRSILNPDYSVRTSSECAFEFGFQGQFLDIESGLMNYGYRYYSPYLGRWTCKDPIAERGGMNLYAMVGNNSPNQVDLLGLEPGDDGSCPKYCYEYEYDEIRTKLDPDDSWCRAKMSLKGGDSAAIDEFAKQYADAQDAVKCGELKKCCVKGARKIKANFSENELPPVELGRCKYTSTVINLEVRTYEVKKQGEDESNE